MTFMLPPPHFLNSRIATGWETVLLDALHAMRSLLCTATNATPHELFLRFLSQVSQRVSPYQLG